MNSKLFILLIFTTSLIGSVIQSISPIFPRKSFCRYEKVDKPYPHMEMKWDYPPQLYEVDAKTYRQIMLSSYDGKIGNVHCWTRSLSTIALLEDKIVFVFQVIYYSFKLSFIHALLCSLYLTVDKYLKLLIIMIVPLLMITNKINLEQELSKFYLLLTSIYCDGFYGLILWISALPFW